jgi:DNA-binding NtrC family response regulator
VIEPVYSPTAGALTVHMIAILHPHTRDEECRSLERAVPTILLVDDDSAVRPVIADYLESSDFDVIAVSDTVMALHQLAVHPEVDLCLVDIVMPSNTPDGLAFARSVRSQRPAMPVILMTGYYSAAARVTNMVSRLIYKPIDLDKLVADIRGLLTH